MWIESVLRHSFLACNLLWPCSLIETSDSELSGIQWSRKVSYLECRVSCWSGVKQRRWRDTVWRERHCLVTKPINQLTNHPIRAHINIYMRINSTQYIRYKCYFFLNFIQLKIICAQNVIYIAIMLTKRCNRSYPLFLRSLQLSTGLACHPPCHPRCSLSPAPPASHLLVHPPTHPLTPNV